MQPDDKRVKFHYKKSNLFRVVHADGAWGGLTPELEVFFTFYNTRPPIPEILVHSIKSDGTLGDDIPELKVAKDGLVREVEVGIVMTQQHAQELIDFLKVRLEQAQQIKAQVDARKTEPKVGRKK